MTQTLPEEAAWPLRESLLEVVAVDMMILDVSLVAFVAMILGLIVMPERKTSSHATTSAPVAAGA